MTVVQDIYEWSLTRPLWQRDGLRRLLHQGLLTRQDVEELAQICRSEVGLSPPSSATVTPVGLSESDFGDAQSKSPGVRISSVRDTQYVNALAPGKALRLQANGVTVVYGDNGAGKSGYVRVLKKLCRARGGAHSIHPNIFQQAAGTPSATIDFAVGNEERTHVWIDGQPGPAELASVTIFDSETAAVYVENENDVAYRPFGLDLLSKLASACGSVRAALSSELSSLRQTERAHPELLGETAVGDLLRALEAEGSESELERLATVTEKDQQRLGQLKLLVAQFDADDPRRLANELRLRAKRIDSVLRRVERVEGALGESAAAALFAAVARAATAAEAVRLAHDAAFRDEPLPNVGGVTWKALWEAARRYSETEAYPGQRFPVVTEDAVCVLCERKLDDTAAKRLGSFESFVRGDTERAAARAESEVSRIRDTLTSTRVNEHDDAMTLAELETEDSATSVALREFLEQVEVRRQSLLAAVASLEVRQAPPVPPSPRAGLKFISTQLEARAVEYDRAETADERQRLRRELAELIARGQLHSAKGDISACIITRRTARKLERALELTDTNAITRKNTELTKTVVTDRLRELFHTELRALDLGDLSLSVEPTGGQRGILYHKIEFKSAVAGRWAIQEILSQGEHRCIALAAFLAELATAPDSAQVVLDDPVSSLDQARRKAVAKRVIEEAKARPVVVFTHDLVFLLLLQEHAESQGIAFAGRHLRRGPHGLGVPVEDLPWYGLPVKKRLGHLKNLWQQSEKTFRTVGLDAYEREAAHIYGLLRESWERAVEEVLLNGAVIRYGSEVHTKQLEKVDILPEDYQAIEAGMSKCSQWLPGHDQAPAVNAPMPKPEELQQDIAELEDWIAAVRKRRAT